MRWRFDWRASGIGLSLLAGVFALYAWFPVTMEEIEEQVFDQYQRWKPRPYLVEYPEEPGIMYEPPVKVVDIDEASLKSLGQWPWPRTYLAEMVRRLSDAGAAVVAFDMTFAEADRTSPIRLAETLGRFGSSEARLFEGRGELPDHDLIFGDMIAQTPVVLGMIATDAPLETRVPPQPSGIAVSGDGGDIRPVLEFFRGAVPNLSVLSDRAAGIGSIALAKNEGSIIRRVPLIVGLSGNPYPYPGLAIEALRVAQGAPSHVVKTSRGSGETDLGAGVSIVSIKIGRAIVPLDANGTLRVRYSGVEQERVIPARRLLEPSGLSPEIAEQIAGRIIFVGSSAATLFDVKTTPFSQRISGVHIHAEIVEQILAGAHLSRPDWEAGLSRLLMVGFGALVIVLLALDMPLVAFIVIGLCAASVGGGSWYVFDTSDLLVSPVGPMLAFFTPYFGMSGYKYFVSEVGRREVTRQFEHFVAPEVIADIIDNPNRHLTPGGAQRELSIMFLDVRRFSTITEKMEPQEVIAFINQMLTPLTDAILDHEGTIDKYMGDAVMAFWNAPRETGAHEAKAIRAMLAFDPVMCALNAEFAANGMPHIEIGVGINTGVCSVGNMGSLKRLAYSCVGDAVNLASRLEGQTKAYGVGNLVGSRTARGAPGFALVELDSVAVKGRTQPETVYTVAGDAAVAADPGFQTLHAQLTGARAAYLAQLWDTAEEGFRDAALMAPVGILDPKPMCEVMIERIHHFREAPPPEDWDGVYIATSK